MHKVILNIALIMLMLPFGLSANETGIESMENIIFAQIDDLIITENEFEEIFKAAVRHKYYHGRVPVNELKQFKKKVAEEIVTQIMVHRDAQEKGLKPDRRGIAEGIDDFNFKYANSPEWQIQRERIVPLLIKRLERKSLIEKMEAKVKNIAEPQAIQIVEYYQKNLQKFTEPRRIWGSVILLKVPPSASNKMWTVASDAAIQLKRRIEQGEDFALIAKKFSAHASAVSGGDLGYFHRGMLEADVQKTVETLAINQISDPIRVLEGITLFRLNGVQSKKIKLFDEVKQRAAGLLYRELQGRAWENYLGDLQASSNIYLNEKLYVRNNYE